MYLKTTNMNSINLMRGWEAMSLATTGGEVSPSLRKKKLSSLLTVMACFKLRRYGKRSTLC